MGTIRRRSGALRKGTEGPLARVAADPELRLRDIAAALGITEHTAGQIVAELEQAGYLTKIRVGRRNRYEVHDELPLRHPDHRHHTIGELIRFLGAPPETERANDPPRPG